MIIAVDFDGTCVTHSFPKVGKNIGAAHILRELVQQGHRLILYTMRANCEDNTGFSEEVPQIHNGPFLDEAIEWFADNGIELYAHQENPSQKSWTTSPKCYAELYIDDAALGTPLVRDNEISSRSFVCWKSVLKILLDEQILSLEGNEVDQFRNQIDEELSTARLFNLS